MLGSAGGVGAYGEGSTSRNVSVAGGLTVYEKWNCRGVEKTAGMTKLAVRLISLVLAASLLAAAPPPEDLNGNADGAFEALAQTYYQQLFRTSPIYATNVGVHDYDGMLGDFSADAVKSQIATDKDYLTRLDGIDPTWLSLSVQLDQILLENRIRDRLLLAETLRDLAPQPRLLHPRRERRRSSR